MSKVKEAIEEMIEESYLLGLTEDEIRGDFSRFIDTCYTVIRTHVRDRAAVSGLVEDLAREKTCILIADRTEARHGRGTADGAADPAGQESAEMFAEKVARRKRMILKALGRFDPRLVRLIDEQRFQAHGNGRKLPPVARSWVGGDRMRLLLLRAGYALSVIVILFLIYLNYVHGP